MPLDDLNVRSRVFQPRFGLSASGPTPVIVHTGRNDRKGSNTAV